MVISGDPQRDKEEHPTVAAQIAFENDHPIVVPDKLARPHPLVAKARNDEIWLPFRTSPKQQLRAFRFFDTLFKAAEERGFVVKHSGKPRESRTAIDVHGEEIAISLDEPNKRSDHILTSREEKDRKDGRGWYIDRYDFTPTGRFIFSLDVWTRERLQHRWTDRDRRPIEARLNEIMIALVRISVTVLRPRRLEAARQHELQLERERRWQIERAKLDAVNKALPDWRTAQDLREFIAAVEREAEASGVSLEEGCLSEWLGWASNLADRSDPVKNFVRDLSKQTARDKT